MATAKVAVPEFQATAIDAVPAIARTVRQTFRTHKTKSVEWRKVQLRKLYWAVNDYTPQLLEALDHDFRKARFESMLTEVDWIKNDCLFMLKHIDAYAKDHKLGSPDVPLTFATMGFRLRKEPLGAVLIIGPYNYPVQLLLGPLVGAIAAGCTAVIKPSESAPATAMVIQEMIGKYLDPNAFVTVNGAVPETTALLNEKWDKIMYTGSANVGSIIAKKAAETLTPVCLELGGKNPAFITKNANLGLAARRLLWGKVFNAGQVCMSHNYILIDKEVVSTFIEHLKMANKDFFPNGVKESPDYCRIINKRQFQRMKKMLDESKGKIVMGGGMDEADLFIEPTAVLVNSMDDSMVAEESFGPLFAIYPFNTLDEALNIANRVHRTPLALFTFGSKAENQKVLNEMTSGGATVNDSYNHGSLNTVPFGGVGDSGWGAYRGRASFDCFTHARTVAETPGYMDKLLRVRYMPYQWGELRRLKALTGESPNFDRNGRVVRGVGYWLDLLLGLGARGAKGALLRWMLLVLLAATARRGGWLPGLFGTDGSRV